MSIGDTAALKRAYAEASARILLTVPGSRGERIGEIGLVQFGQPRYGAYAEVIAGDESAWNALALGAQLGLELPYFVSHFRVGDDQTLEQMQVRRVAHNTIMARSLDDIPVRQDRSLRRLTTREEVDELGVLRDDKALEGCVPTADVQFFVLDVEDTPVTSALLVTLESGIGMLEHVQTFPYYRRRGYARWICRALQAEAKCSGMHAMVLGANEAGKGLYEALDYTAIGQQDVYFVQPQSAELEFDS